MATPISVPGAGNVPPLIFNVSGQSLTNYALAFQTALQNASQAGSLTVNVLSQPGPAAQPNAQTGTVLNEMLSNTTQDAYTIPGGGEYSLALVGSPTTITGSAAGADTFFGGGNVNYIAGGANDQVNFVAGNNFFFGDAASGDTVTGGIGYDSIFTGTGSTTVFSGAGHTLIDLADTGSAGDIAYLGDGNATVDAFGQNDTVATGTPGQAIFTGTGNTTVVIANASSVSAASADTITAGAGTTSVFDSVGGSHIYGGTGSLVFVGEANNGFSGADSITAGTGTTAVFGANNVDINLSGSSTSGAVYVVAGSGNETLNGALTNNFNFFGSTDSTSSVVATGGAGNDYFSTGTGSESLYGGSGTDVFALNTINGSHGNITIYDFSAADSVSVDANNQYNATHGTVSGGNYTITLTDDTTVTFVGVTSLSGHII